MAGGFKPVAAQSGFQFRIDGHAGRIVTAIPVDGFGAGFLDQMAHDLTRRAVAKNQSTTVGLKRLVEADEGVMQPPCLCRTERAGTHFLRLANVEGDDRACGLQCRQKRPVVIETQILAEPKDGWIRVGIWHGGSLRQE